MVNLYFTGPLVGFQPETIGGTGEAYKLETSNFYQIKEIKVVRRHVPKTAVEMVKTGCFRTETVDIEVQGLLNGLLESANHIRFSAVRNAAASAPDILLTKEPNFKINTFQLFQNVNICQRQDRSLSFLLMKIVNNWG